MRKLTHDDIYRVLAGSLMVPLTDFNPNDDLIVQYNFDSLAVYELGFLIEEEYGVYIDIPRTLMSKITTAKDLADFIVEG